MTSQEIMRAHEAAQAPVERDEPTTLLQVIANAARDPSCDVEKMRALLEMKKEVEAIDAERAFNDAMSKAQAEMPRVLRDAANATTNSRYARLETVSKAMNPVITKHGFSMSYGTDTSPLEKHYRVTCILSHVGGHSRSYHADIPADLTGMKGNPNKTPTHAFGSTMSYGRRYLKLMIFDVALVNEDDDANAAGGVETITEQQALELDTLIAETKSDRNKFLAWLGVEHILKTPARHFDKAKDVLEQKKRAKKADAADA